MERLLIYPIVAVVGLSLIYWFLPFRMIGAKKPFFSIFPKYRIDISRVPDFELNLQRAGFVKSPANQDLYLRGKVYGDFSAKYLRLVVRIDRELEYATIGSPLMVIAFDTGDLWQLSHALITGR